MRISTKKVLLILFMVSVLVSAGFAQQNVGVVNSREILDKSIEGKKIMNRLQQKEKEYKTKLAAMDEDIRKLNTKLSTQRLTLTDEAMVQLSSDLDKKKTDQKRFAEDAQREMQSLMNRLFQRLQIEVVPIIEAVGKEKNLVAIFDLEKSGMIYFNSAIDITNEVIQKYDASKAGKK
jgi:Skp family chaperone for outer membrane proteins